MSQEVKLNFKENTIEAVVENGSVVQKKLIGFKQVASLLSNGQNYDSGFLPGEYGMQRIVSKDNDTYYLYTEPAKMSKVRYESNDIHDHLDRDDFYEDGEFDNEDYQDAVQELIDEGIIETETYDFTTPSLVWMVKLRKGRERPMSIKLYAIKSPIYTGLEQLYYPPFHNIYDDSQVCWGSDVLLPTPKAIQGLSTVFLGSESNMDLREGRVNTFRRRVNNMDVEGFYPVHLHAEISNQLATGTTPKKALEFTHNVMRTSGRTVSSAFENFTNNNNYD